MEITSTEAIVIRWALLNSVRERIERIAEKQQRAGYLLGMLGDSVSIELNAIKDELELDERIRRNFPETFTASTSEYLNSRAQRHADLYNVYLGKYTDSVILFTGTEDES